jgi:hypothetical protein
VDIHRHPKTLEPIGRLYYTKDRQWSLLVFGAYTKKGSWQGADSALGAFGEAGRLDRFIQYLASQYRAGHNVVLEGASIFNTSKIGVESFRDVFGIKQGRWYIFTYDRPEEYLARVKTRSGKDGDAEKSFAQHNSRYKTWVDKVNTAAFPSQDYRAWGFNYDASPFVLGEPLLRGLPPSVVDYFIPTMTGRVNRLVLEDQAVEDDGRLL